MTGYFSFTELMVTQKIQGIINLVQMSSGLFKVLRWGNAITTVYDSFTGDTLVWTENGTIAISEVAIGDEVYAYDAETGEAIIAKVTDISVSETNELVHLTIDGELIRTTASHPFYTASGEWKAAGDLNVGDHVVTMTGEATVEAVAVEKLSEAVTVYNLTVEGEHNYYVAENGVLVHNVCDGVGSTNQSTDYYVTPNGDVIPASRNEFDANLSMMTENNGKYTGESSKGPVRVRVEDAHPATPGYSGPTDNDHLVDHVHIEYRENGATGGWGKGNGNKISIPQSWLE